MKRLALILILFLLIPTLVMAKDEGADVVSTDRVIIEKGDVADNVVVLFNDAAIDGKVNDSVFVIMGNADLGENAKVGGRIMVIGGDIRVPQGFKTGKGLYHIDLKGDGLNEFLLSILGFAGLEFVRLFFLLFLMVVSVVIGLAFPGWTGRVSDKLSGVGKAVGLGIVLFLILATAAMMMVFTVVGIPIAVFIAVLTAVFMVLGFSVSSFTVGKGILDRMGYDTGGFASPLVGSAILLAFSGIPVIGLVLMLVFSVAGMGAIIENLIRI